MNTQTDTPETDALRNKRAWLTNGSDWTDDDARAFIGLSEKLERERDAALRELAELRKDKERDFEIAKQRFEQNMEELRQSANTNEKDKARLDWLFSPNTQEKWKAVERNFYYPSNMKAREAIDAAKEAL